MLSTFNNIAFSVATLAQTAPIQDITNNAKTIIWGKYDLPPVFISSGPHVNQGTNDLIVAYTAKHMGNYNHTSYISSIARVVNDMTAGRPVCSLLLKNSERQKIAHFSTPAIIIPTHRIFYLTKNETKIFNALEKPVSSSISFQDIMARNDKLRLGLVAQRSYSATIDKTILKHKKKIIFRYGKGSMDGVISMLIKNRIDYTIEYPNFFLFKSDTASKATAFKSVPIDGMQETTFGYFACSKNKWGKSVIDNINLYLKEHRSKIAYKNIMKRWLSDEDAKIIDKYYPSYMQDTNVPNP